MKKNNHSIVYQNKASQPVGNPRGEVSQKRADLKHRAELQKEAVEMDLMKIKKDARKVLFIAGAAFVTFQVVRALTKEKKPDEHKQPEPSPTPTPDAPPTGPSPVAEKQNFGAMVFKWIKNEVVSYAAGRVKDYVYNYVQSRINKQQNAEENTSDTDSEKAARD